MSLFESAVQSHYPNIVDTPISIGNRFNFAIKEPEVREALGVINGGSISKSELLSIWANERDYSFKTKFLLTLFWGHVRPINLQYILADDGLDCKLYKLECALHDFEDFSDKKLDKRHPYDDIQSLYKELECGEMRIKGLKAAFFTKIFFFFFATHTTFFSENGTQIIIADEWMKKAVYAQITETFPEMLNKIFSPGTKYPCRFNFKGRTSSEAYFNFLKVFEMEKNALLFKYPELDSFTLEGYVFASQDLIDEYYRQAIGQ